ncbi:uncharacterized protein [Glycine max]|uniref:uncharacterized protein n=1 Tax=Glycine max TaxID=3847 RepID=UPI0003DECA5F|nr:uncharacterized protein LOC102668483 [Glycine max]|eukprot:XP_006582694.1 uncharacterized protein LOC102668483 [Glycine max]
MGRNNGGPSEFRIFGAMETQNPSQGGSVCMETNQKQSTNKEKSQQEAVQVNDMLCPFCKNKEEDAAHLFFTCNSILPLWWESMPWDNLSSAMPQHPRDHYLQHGHNAAEGKKSTRWKCWWIALTSTIWKHRNKIVFQNANFDGSKLMDDAVFLIWSWIKTMEKDFVMHFNHWSSNLKEGFSS